LIEHGRYADALVPLSTFVSAYPTSSAVPEARSLMHRARLQGALGQASSESRETNARGPRAARASLSSERVDFAVSAAGIARATILWQQGTQRQAPALLIDALDS